MTNYGKTQGHHCWWLTKDGKSLANFDDEKEVDAIIALQESVEDSTTSAFGDGWYDGFLDAQKLAENEDSCLEDIKEDEVRDMSEHAESKHAELKAKAA
ncbi:MAG: hypothetical protein COB35_12665 [Gammaproteobacteria bacterium]|nr:MAG: hypothetical protein COB35_12665 [Gammaproteobacteria bacterium]